MQANTQGPWELWRQGIEIQSDPESGYFGHEVGVVINGIPCSLCCVPISQIASNHGEDERLVISKEESLANAYLMAAAPDLFEALAKINMACNHLATGKVPWENAPILIQQFIDISREAIAKAVVGNTSKIEEEEA